MAADETPGRVASTLTEIRERYAARPGDVERLLAAVDAALKHHQRIGRHPDLSPVCGCSRLTWPCPEVAAITAALAGTQPSEDENHD